MLEARGVKVFDVTEEAEQGWTDIILSTWRDNSAFMAACTPSRLNFEGDPSMLNPRSGAYGGGYGNFFGYRDLLAEWRAQWRLRGVGAHRGRRRVMSVAVVTGGAVGIGAAIAEELGRQGVFVVTVDPGVAVDGTPQSGDATPRRSTAQRIVDAGGQARASNISVTDDDAVRDLFAGLVDEFGALDAVVNVAGISRPTGFASGVEDDWRAVLDVHVNGYLNVLRAALPIMTAAGHGRILGVTSGSGWRAADAGAYSCAKRTVAALTWQIGQEAPDGRDRQRAVAHRRDADGDVGAVTAGRRRQPHREVGRLRRRVARRVAAARATSVRSARTSRARSSPRGARGQIMFSNGAEVAWVVPPRLLEVARTADVASLAALLDAVVPAALAPAEAAQASNGGGVPRLGSAFDDAAADVDARLAGHALRRRHRRPRVGRRARRRAHRARRRSASASGEDPATGFDAAAEQLAGVARDAGPIDAVVVALAGNEAIACASPTSRAGSRSSTSTPGSPTSIGTDAAWVRAVADHLRGDRPSRPRRHRRRRHDRGRPEPRPGRGPARPRCPRRDRPIASTRSRSAWRAREASALRTAAELVAHLVSSDAGALSGAELVADADWFGLRSHPQPGRDALVRGPGRPRLARRRAPRAWSPATALVATPSGPVRPAGGRDVRTHRTHRRRAHPPVGSGARRLVPLPRRPA